MERTSTPADVARRLPVGELEWDDLVVEAAVADRLRALVDRAALGGLAVLLHGPAGVGKTFAVRVWAEAMRLDLWAVDCAALVARHGSATADRGLAEVVALGERPHAVLLFHDADALCAPAAGDALRAVVGRAAARRAPTVLETRAAGLAAVSAALHGRGVEAVGIGPPGPELRRRLWERLVRRASPLSDPDLEALAAVELPGAAIDAAVSAVVLAAGDERLETAALLAAARSAARAVG